MNIEQVRQYCLAKNGVTESFPFDGDTLVFKVAGKMFALCSLERKPFRISLKCDPEKAVELRAEYPGTIAGAYHMNKKHWNMIVAEQLPLALDKELVDHSYDLVVASLPKYKQKELFNRDPS